MKRLLVSAVATAALDALVGPVAPALAAPAHAVQHGLTVRHTHAVHPARAAHQPVDHLKGVRQGASRQIDALTRSTARLAAREGTSTVLNDTDRAALAVATQDALTSLRADKASVGAATTRTQITAARSAAVLTGQVAGTQFSVVTTADEDQTQAAALVAAADALQVQLDAASVAAVDTTTAQAALTDLRAQAAAATTSAQAATADVLALAATGARAELRAARDAVQAEFDTVTAALSAATADQAVIEAALAPTAPLV